MSYRFIKHTLVAHFPRQNEMGDLMCACGDYEDFDHSDPDQADRWAEHVENVYNEVPVVARP